MREIPLDIPGPGPTLSAALTVPELKRWPLVILCHGYLSHKDSSKYRLMAGSLAREGLASLRFDFRGCGSSGGEFFESVPSARLKDLFRALDAGRNLDGFSGRMGIMGGSLGAYLGFLAAARDQRIAAVALWSCPADLGLLGARAGERGTERLMDDIRGLPPVRSAGPGAPGIVVHGEKDELVPVAHGICVYMALTTPKRLAILGGADHRIADQEIRLRATRMTVNWLKGLLEEN